MLAVIDSKRRALRDDKENLDITNGKGSVELLVLCAMVDFGDLRLTCTLPFFLFLDFALEPTSRAHQTRKLRKRGADNEVGAKNSKKKASQPPAAKWLAIDADALDDLGLMRKV